MTKLSVVCRSVAKSASIRPIGSRRTEVKLGMRSHGVFGESRRRKRLSEGTRRSRSVGGAHGGIDPNPRLRDGGGEVSIANGAWPSTHDVTHSRVVFISSQNRPRRRPPTRRCVQADPIGAGRQ